MDSSGYVYVTDRGHHRVQKFDSSGNYITKWGSYGTGDGQFNFPVGIAVDGSGYVYVVEAFNNRVQKFNSDGTFVLKWGSSGSGDGQFNMPWGVSVDSTGHVYVADTGNKRLQIFDSSGNFETKWTVPDREDFYPRWLAVDSSAHVFVSIGDMILKFASNGQVMTTLGSRGSGDGQFMGEVGIALDSNGIVYAVDKGGGRIQIFRPINN